MRQSTRTFLWSGMIACAVPLALGCSSDGSPAGAGAGGAGGPGDAGGTGGAGGTATTPDATTIASPCGEPDAELPAGAVCVTEVRGSLADVDGDPPHEGFLVTVCGPVCFYGETDAAGGFVVEVGTHIVPSAYSTLPHGRPFVAGYYFALDPGATGPVIDVGELLAVDMPASGVVIDLDGAAEQRLVSGGVTLHIDAGVETRLEFDDLAAGADGEQFRALSVPSTLMPRLADPALGLDALYMIGPFESFQRRLSDGEQVPTRLSFDNELGLAAGTAVEFLALGSYLYPDWLTPAAYELAATGAVSADGATIEMTPGEGLDYLTAVGIRPTN